MPISPELRRSLIEKYSTHGLDRALLERIIDDVAQSAGPEPDAGSAPAAPFDVSWMDSYLAHWTIGRNVTPAHDRFDEITELLREMMDARFEERKADILRWIRGVPILAPDGGPPEPGTPPVGPVALEPPDGGPPEPGVPPVGPVAGFPSDNPWILYWFISLKAPMLLDVIDAHLTRRLGELGFEPR